MSSLRFQSPGGRRAGFGVLTVASLLLGLLAVAPVFAGEINDSNERIEKIVIAVNGDPERDPELSVGGETITVYEGDYVTFRIALNDDQDRPNFDRTARVKDVYKKARFEFVAIRSEFGHTCTDPDLADPADGSVECDVTLDENGNAAVRITLRALDIGGAQTDPNGCVKTTNNVNSVHPSGGDQAQVEICPASQRPEGASTPPPTWPPPQAGGASPTTAAPTGGPAAGALPDAATGGQLPALAVLLAAALVLASGVALVTPRFRGAARRDR